MKPTFIAKLQELKQRYQELTVLLSDPKIISQQSEFCNLSREYAQLSEVVNCFEQWSACTMEIQKTEELLTDPDLKEIAQEELVRNKSRLEHLSQQLHYHLLPRDPQDNANCFLEIRAGTGGDEAAIFVGDLFRMYNRYTESLGWQLQLINTHLGEHGGFKEVIAKITGLGAYGSLKFESGGHRVQRVPLTETQGRIHTSACTIAVLPEVPETEVLKIQQTDLKIDTFRSSGAGGQHVNTTDSAIRITHIPTGIVVECQDERSQHKNRAKAMAVLAARINAAEEAARSQEIAAVRRNLLGSGDRSDRIRTYNFAQNRVTDHRINLTLYSLNELLAGELDLLVKPLQKEYQMDLLTQLTAQSN